MTSRVGRHVRPWLTSSGVRFNTGAEASRHTIPVQPVPRVFIVIVVITLVDFLGWLTHHAWRSRSRRCRFLPRRHGDIRRLIGDIGFLQINHFRARLRRIAEFRNALRVFALVNLRAGQARQYQSDSSQ